MKNKFLYLIFTFFVIVGLVSCGISDNNISASVVDAKKIEESPADTSEPYYDKETTRVFRTGSRSIKRATTSSGLKAGFSDDNKQFNYFLNFLNKYKNNTTRKYHDIENKVTLRVMDKNHKTIANAKVIDTNTQKESLTYSDGSFLVYRPTKLKITHKNSTKTITIDENSKKVVDVVLNQAFKPVDPIPVDIVFALDTTGSMSEEIRRLKKTIEIIYLNLSNLKTKINLRFGMVLYKDRKDKYTTKISPLTDDLKSFQKALNKVTANGGGDRPEDLVSALRDTVYDIKWQKDGLKIVFVITDAPPHIHYHDLKPYMFYADVAKQKAIKLHTIGTGGLGIDGEYALRQLSQYTNGKYIFLTYGEKTQSDGGKTGSVSHHTGSNFSTDKLEKIVIKFVKEDIAKIASEKIVDDEYFEATKIDSESKQQTTTKLFDKAFAQIVDYSSIKIDKNSLSLLPIITSKYEKDKKTKIDAEYFSQQLLQSVKKNKNFKLIERNDMQKIMDEMKFQDSGLVDEKKAVKFGKIVGAEFLLISRIYKKNNRYELYIKLLHLSTAEVVSVTKVYIDKRLGI